MARRAFVLGPRFAFSARAGACERCVFGTGKHAEWCTAPLVETPAACGNVCGRAVCTGKVVTTGADMYCSCDLGRELRLKDHPRSKYVAV